ncbi:MAG: hypothetical protein AAF591_04100 [Verrucomicrobiota bacterium]
MTNASESVIPREGETQACAAILCEPDDDTVALVQVDGMAGRKAANEWYEEFLGGAISRVPIVTNA